MTRFVIAPQWQGSSSSRAMQLIDGAEAIAGDLPRAATIALEAPTEAGDAQGSGIHRLSAVVRMRDRIEDAVRGTDEPVVTIGGDCGVALGAISAIAGDDLAVVWLDAHPDLNTAASSPSGAFTGMVLRSILGEGEPTVRLTPGIAPSRIVLAGTRAWDAEEERVVAAHGIRTIGAGDLADAEVLAAAVAATGASRVFVHIDLDVLDPSEISGIASPVPFGVAAAEVVASVRRLRERVPLAGATITEFSPWSERSREPDPPSTGRLARTRRSGGRARTPDRPVPPVRAAGLPRQSRRLLVRPHRGVGVGLAVEHRPHRASERTLGVPRTPAVGVPPRRRLRGRLLPHR